MIINYISQSYWAPKSGNNLEDYRNYLWTMIEDCWNVFEQEFDQLWEEKGQYNFEWNYPSGDDDFKIYRHRYVSNLFSESLGFAACKMMRRVLGLAKNADFTSIEDLEIRVSIERKILSTAKIIILNREKIDDLRQLRDILHT